MTTPQSEEEKEPGLQMPGTKAKQARALAFNIEWLGETFGVERIGFLTLTVGDLVNGRFEKLKARAEAERRFNSMLNRIRERYRCGVIVTERHKDGGMHYHLLVVVEGDIQTGLDFAAVGRRDYRSASHALREEWAWWREHQSSYGFGRHELLPVRTSAQQVGRYVAKYLGKSWSERRPEDKGKRCVRYFGRWSKSGVKCGPPMSSRHGSLTPRAKAWRECCKQVQAATKWHGVELTSENIKSFNGPRWAWRLTKQMQRHEFFIVGRAKEGLEQHNAEAATLSSAHVGRSSLDSWIPSPVESGDDYSVSKVRAGNNRERKMVGHLRVAEFIHSQHFERLDTEDWKRAESEHGYNESRERALAESYAFVIEWSAHPDGWGWVERECNWSDWGKAET